MKRILLSLVTVVMTISCALAAETSYTITFKSASSDQSAALTAANATAQIEEGAEFVSSVSATNNVYPGKNGLKFSSSGTNGAITFVLSSEGEKEATKIVVSAAQYGSDKCSLSVNGGTSQTISGTSLTDYTFDGGDLTQIKLSATKRLYVKSITVYYEAGASEVIKEDPELSFPETEYSATIGEAFTAPVLSNPNNLAVTYSSSNEAVATVDANGNVSLVGAGKTKITATFAGNDDFYAGSASYDLTVTDPNATDVTFDFINQDYGLERGGSGYTTSGSIESDGVKLTFSKTSGNGFRLWSDGLRVYTGNASITVSVPNCNVTGIEMGVKASIASVKIGGATVSVASNTYSWTGSESEVTIEMNPSATGAITTLTVHFAKLGDPSKADAELSFGENTSFTIVKGDAFTAPTLVNPNNLAVTYTSSDEAVATVNATTGAVTVVGAGTTTIKASSEATDKYNEGSASYTLTVVALANSFAEAYKVGNDEDVYINFPMVVTYVNGQYCYVQNEAGDEFGLVYGNTTYEKGDVIPKGWTGTYTLYYGLNEIKVGNNMPAATEKAEVNYAYASAITEENVNQIVILHNVEFAAATPDAASNFTGTFDGEDLTFRNTLKIASVDAGTYDVTAAVSIYNGTLQLVPIAYEEVANLVEAPEVVVNGGKDTVEDENGDVVLEFTVDNSKGEYIWYMVTPIAEKAPVAPKTAALEGYKKLEGTTLSVANNNNVSYYLGDADGKQLSEVAVQTVDFTTGIAAIEAENGEKVVYDMMGRRVVRTEGLKGLYIINGKKVAL